MITAKKTSMNKYLKLEFKNAGLFSIKGSSGDKSFNMGMSEGRSFEYVQPITTHQISNMLCVLFGERPKPIHRDTVYGSNDYLYEKASQSYLKIISYTDENGKYYKQTMQTKKAILNSTSKDSTIYWLRVEKFLDDYYTTFIECMKEVFEFDVTTIKFTEFIPLLRDKRNDSRILEQFDYMLKNGLTALYSYIFHDDPSKKYSKDHINANPKTRLTVTTGLDKITKLDGEILVPVSSVDIEKIKNNKGCATILDGGMVIIKRLIHEDYVSTMGYTLVGDISQEKILIISKK